MANLIITYWRDIPSAVSVKAGRKEEKRMLADRFQEAIDMAAMRGGASDTDSYLADWRRAEGVAPSGALSQELIEQRRSRLATAQAQVIAAEAQLAEMRARLARMSLRAPAEGIILSRAAEVGQIVLPKKLWWGCCLPIEM